MTGAIRGRMEDEPLPMVFPHASEARVGAPRAYQGDTWAVAP